ncbi:hypothetical protein AGLY_000258 [Aphis glycines]|uniref:Uncharacterized protein n=1 Tax=Aphis glycines TaxID=307491 RepID=A0A6G0U919_APHGL|nr:hypothetical protein AGLY_000258 [Aphis glycines]
MQRSLSQKYISFMKSKITVINRMILSKLPYTKPQTMVVIFCGTCYAQLNIQVLRNLSNPPRITSECVDKIDNESIIIVDVCVRLTKKSLAHTITLPTQILKEQRCLFCQKYPASKNVEDIREESMTMTTAESKIVILKRILIINNLLTKTIYRYSKYSRTPKLVTVKHIFSVFFGKHVFLDSDATVHYHIPKKKANENSDWFEMVCQLTRIAFSSGNAYNSLKTFSVYFQEYNLHLCDQLSFIIPNIKNNLLTFSEIISTNIWYQHNNIISTTTTTTTTTTKINNIIINNSFNLPAVTLTTGTSHFPPVNPAGQLHIAIDRPTCLKEHTRYKRFRESH